MTAINIPASISLSAPLAVLWNDDPTYAEYLAATFGMLWKQSVLADQRMKELLEESPRTLDG
jgi:hypothetical protein